MRLLTLYIHRHASIIRVVLMTNQESDEKNWHKHHKYNEEDVGHGIIDQVGVAIIKYRPKFQISCALDQCIDNRASRSGECFKETGFLLYKM